MKNVPTTFELSEIQQLAIEILAGEKIVMFSSHVVGSKVTVDYVTCKAPFVTCKGHGITGAATFLNCNAPFIGCADHIAAGNVTFAACNIPLKK